ncbi:hypothetical protein B0H16DRAFT_1481373 [Mycena metata]|uniref:Uncharacterized protein n=1 Tax=Mycena metata TaxID=1033252 RepID=A0AAD7MAL0_9AGAR|nr:hypothetical protein B0H16DRAFT_1481373 [Mycena metata]
MGGPVISYHHHPGDGNVMPPPQLPTRRRGCLRHTLPGTTRPHNHGDALIIGTWLGVAEPHPHHGSPTAATALPQILRDGDARPSRKRGGHAADESPQGFHKAQRTESTDDASANLPDIRAAHSPQNRRISGPTASGFDAPDPPRFTLSAPPDPIHTSRRERDRLHRRADSPTPNSGKKPHPAPRQSPEEGEGEQNGNLNEDALMTDLTKDNGGGAPQPLRIQDNRSQHASPPRANGANGASNNQGEEELARVIRPLPFTHPTEALFLARSPLRHFQSPHRKNPAYELPLAGPDDMPVKVSFQPTDGNFDCPVIDGRLAVANVPQAFIDTLNANPDDFGLIVPFLGGSALIAAYGNDNLVAAISNVVLDAGLVGPNDIEVIPIDAAKPGSRNDLYAPPFVLALRASDTVLGRLATVATFIANADLAFHVIRYNSGLRTWTVALYTASSMGGHKSNGGYLRWCVACLILDNADVRRAFQRATGTADRRPIQTRLLDWARTVYVTWNEHSKHWCVYAEPCTPDFDGWESVRTTMRTLPLHHAASLRSFKPVASRGDQAPFCLNCKNDDHLHYGCPTRLDDPESYWGPKVQLAAVTEGILAKKPKTGGGGGPQNHGGGQRGGARNGRGGAGPSRPRNTQSQRR